MKVKEKKFQLLEKLYFFKKRQISTYYTLKTTNQSEEVKELIKKENEKEKLLLIFTGPEIEKRKCFFF